LEIRLTGGPVPGIEAGLADEIRLGIQNHAGQAHPESKKQGPFHITLHPASYFPLVQ
jgi:hypothetical protein